jgi:hypothetical protein
MAYISRSGEEPAPLASAQEKEACCAATDLIAHGVKIGNVETLPAIDVYTRETTAPISYPGKYKTEKLPPTVSFRHRTERTTEALTDRVQPLEDAFSFSGNSAYQPLANCAALKPQSV